MTGLVRAALLLTALLGLIAAGGCGSDTKSSNEYVKDLNQVQTDFVNSISKATSSSGSGSAQDQAKKTFASLDTSIDKLISDLKGIDPPDKVKSLHQDLIDEMTQFKAQVNTAAESLASGDSTKIVAAQTKFATEASQLQTQIGKTISGINAKLQGN
jgi:isochorismate synthase EntC